MLTDQWALDQINAQSAETTVGAEKLVARTDKEAASQALGKPLPVVIGTGRVEGVYFIGGVTQVDTTTTTKSWTMEDISEIAQRNVLEGGFGYGPGGEYLGIPVYTATETTTTETATTSKAGYVLAYDFFEVGYDLIRLEIDGIAVYDGEKGIAATQTFRFYGGRHAGADPILSEIIGDNAGAYKNFVMLFLDGYPADRAPSISCVISNGTSDATETVEIAWTGAVPAVMTQNQAGRATAYEPGSGVTYQVIPQSGALMLAVLDSYTYLERYRVPLQGTAGWDSLSRWVMCLRGTGHILLRVAQGGVHQTNRIYDVANGHIVAEYLEDIALDTYDWKIGQRYGDRYMLAGFDLKSGSTGIVYGLVDIAAGTFATGHIAGLTMGGSPTYGPSGNGSVSFFFNTATAVLDATHNGDAWSVATRYTTTGQITATWFDPLTGYLVVAENDGASAFFMKYLNPLTGALIASYSVDAPYFIHSGTNATGRERFWPKTGYVMLSRSTGSTPGRVYLLDIMSRTISVYAEADAGIQTLDFNTGIFDQNRQVWITGYNDDVWTVHKRPNSAPGLMDLDDVVTDVMSLAGFQPADLSFSGFDGIQTWGFVIASDTTIQSAMRTLADIYSFAWCDTGSGFVFKKPSTGDLLAVDAAFTAADIVEREQPVQSSDEADIRTPSAIELDYVSKEGDYKPRPVSFSMTTGVFNSITTPHLSTPILLNDNEAQRICTEKFFEFQEKRRSHSLIVTPEHVEILPGDVVSFPSGTISYTARVEQVAVDLRSMGVEISARDFQTEVETEVTSVSNQVSIAGGTLFYTSQYLHLDMPLYRYADDRLGTELVQYGVVAPRGQALWSGGQLWRGQIVTALIKLFDQMPHRGVVGSCLNVLAAPPDDPGLVDGFVSDEMSTVTIRRLTNDATLLVSRTEAEVLAGANNALVGEPGRWEWVGYKNVTDNGNGTYTLTGFTLRGYRGSEVFSSLHEIGDVFVTLDAAWVRKSLHPLSDLRTRQYYKAAGIGQEVAAIQALPHIITGAAETPYAPVNLAAEVGTPNGIDISWDYRSRLTTGLNPAAYGETGGLRFQVDIYGADGTSYIRTLTSTTNSVHYPTASVVADFGSDPPSQLYFRVFMMSALPLYVPGQDRPVEGRGYEARGHAVLAGSGMPAVVTGQSLTVSVGSVTVDTGGGETTTVPVTGQEMTVSVGTVTVSTGGAGILDGLGATGAWSMSRDLLTSFVGSSRYTDVSGAVSALNDQTGNVRHLTQATGTAQPLVTTAGPNSRTCVDFVSQDYLAGAAISNFIANNAGYLIVSFLPTSITSNVATVYGNHGIVSDGGSQIIGLFLRDTGTPKTIYAYNWDGSIDAASSAAINTGTVYVAEWRHSGGAMSLRVNGGSWIDVASGNTTSLTGLLRLGSGSGTAATSLIGQVFEMAVFSTVPTTGQQDTIAANFKSWVGA